MELVRGKVTIVTGAAVGIGRGVAESFGRQGAPVYLIDIKGEALEQAAAAIREQGGEAYAFPADVRDRAALAQVVDAAIARHGRVDVVINNAGIYPRKAFLDMTEAEWDEVQEINVKGAFHLTQLALPHMVAQGSGRIINISSVTFFWGRELLTHYVASKGALIGFTRTLAREVGPKGVLVNCITPGAILVEAEAAVNTPQQIEALMSIQSIKRRLFPEDIANVCLFLASDLSAGMTGQTLNVDGGRVMH